MRKLFLLYEIAQKLGSNQVGFQIDFSDLDYFDIALQITVIEPRPRADDSSQSELSV